MPGLPGTGLGGLFYALLILWIGCQEGWRTLNGRGDPQRWRRFAGLATLLAAMVAALWVWGLLLGQVAASIDLAQAGSGTASAARRSLEAAIPALTLVPLLVLAGLLSAMHAARLVLRVRNRGAIAALATGTAAIEPQVTH